MPMSPRLLRPRAAGGFSPKKITDLFVWFDASIASSVTIQTGVQKWADSSGNGRDLIQNTTNNQPAYDSVSLNGKPTVTFDGSNDFLRTAAAWTLNQPYQTFAVFRYEAAFSTAGFGIAHNAGTPRAGEMRYQNETIWTTFSGSSLFSSASTGVRQVFNGYDLVVNGASTVMRTKGAVVASGNSGLNNSNGMTVGANGDATASAFGYMSIAEIITYSRELSTAEAASIRNYLSAKWGISYT